VGPEIVWTFWGTEASLACARCQNPDHPVYSLVTVLTMLSWITHNIKE